SYLGICFLIVMIRVIKQYGVSILLLIVAIFCIFNIGQNIQDAFTVITNSLAIFLAIVYFVNFEKDIIIKIKGFLLNIKWPFHGKTKKILTNVLNFIIEKRWDIISYLFIFLLLIITLGQFSYLERFINLAWINKYQVILTVLAILSGGLTFWHNRERVEKEIDQEQITEQGAEDKRRAEFASKFPRINKIPIFRNLVKWMYKEGWFYSISLIIVTTLFLIFGLNHLGQFMSVDEPKWVNTRVPQLFESINRQAWGETFINDKPGILPAFLSGAVNIFLDHDEYKSNPIKYEVYLFWWRFPILFFSFLMLFLIYFFIKKLLDKNYSLLTTGLIALNPVLIGVSQIVNPDATLWNVGFLSFITFFLYLKSSDKKYIWLSGLFFGLALISKYFISIFYIFFFIIICIEYLIKKTNLNQLFQRCLDVGLLYIISIIIYIILFPNTWVNYEQIWKGTIGSGILSPGSNYILVFISLIFLETILLKGSVSNYLRNKFNISKIILLVSSLLFFVFSIILILNVLFGNLFFNFNEYILFYFERGGTNFLPDLLSSLYITLFSMTPLLVIGTFLFFLIFLKFNKKIIKNNYLIILSSFIFILVFIFGSSLGGFIASTRYQILLYPVYTLLFSLFLNNFINIKKNIIYFIFFISIITTFLSNPFYLHYNNFLNLNNYIISDAWGYGGYELAQKLNQLPDSKTITVWTDREGFNEFFVGNSYWRGRDNPFNEDYQIDYLILTNIGERVFNLGLNAYKDERRYLYARVAGENPMLEFYKKERLYEVCINNNPNNCIWAVKFNH
ncbi:MAG: glycosyltransferase family 39 protein, partial [Sphaerochaetaceae bacterium]|nr:glycosyltransferase family 39 protein [Sphaerochaetaceae bacterium]